MTHVQHVRTMVFDADAQVGTIKYIFTVPISVLLDTLYEGYIGFWGAKHVSRFYFSRLSFR